MKYTGELIAECKAARDPFAQQFKALHPDGVPKILGSLKFAGNGRGSAYALVPYPIARRAATARNRAEDEALEKCRSHPQIDASTCKIISPGKNGGIQNDEMGIFTSTYRDASAVAEGKLTSPVEQLEEDLIVAL